MASKRPGPKVIKTDTSLRRAASELVCVIQKGTNTLAYHNSGLSGEAAGIIKSMADGAASALFDILIEKAEHAK